MIAFFNNIGTVPILFFSNLFVNKKKNRKNGRQFILTKGDANMVHDRSLYNPGQDWLEARHILGRAYGHLPYVGIVTIIMNDYPYVKYAVILALALSVILSKDEEQKL